MVFLANQSLQNGFRARSLAPRCFAGVCFAAKAGLQRLSGVACVAFSTWLVLDTPLDCASSRALRPIRRPLGHLSGVALRLRFQSTSCAAGASRSGLARRVRRAYPFVAIACGLTGSSWFAPSLAWAWVGWHTPTCKMISRKIYAAKP